MAETSSDRQTNTDKVSGAPDASPASQLRRAPRLRSLALVDAAGVLAGMSIWAAADMWHAQSGLAIAALVAVGDALFVGSLLAGVVHEWGHYAGAHLSGAQTELVRRRGFALVRFSYVFAENTPKQFRSMSFSGNVAHWLLVAGLFFALPLSTPGQIAVVAAAFAFAVSASVFELPVISAVDGGQGPEAALRARATKETFKRGRWISIASGLLLFIGLS